MHLQPPINSKSPVIKGQWVNKPFLKTPTINRATLFDIPQVLRLERKAFRRDDRCSLSMFLLSIVSPSSMLLAAKVDGFVVGHMLLTRDLDYDFANEIFTIVVSFAYRGRGIARQLIESYTKEYSDSPMLTLQVRDSNSSAIEVYKRIGFEFSETLVGSYPDGEDGHVYIKHIGVSQ